MAEHNLKIKSTFMKLYDNKEDEEHVWRVRESGLGATAFVPGMGDTWEGWEDSAVPPQRMGDYLRDFRKLLEKYGYACALYGHFGQGCLHTRIDFNLVSKEGIVKYRDFTAEAADIVVSYGGSLSGEHGDGQSRAELLEKMFGSELVEAFRQFKSIWDPQWKMNPGKVVQAYRRDENLRLGAGYNPWRPETHFRYPEDHGDFSHAGLRCVGVGECRRMEGKTMCPSYRVTREEMHTTRGRGHLLFEMMHGDPLQRTWDNEPVKEALDLCLACKGCKGDCPVNVDIATYKAEFLAHYYEHHRRPLHTYGFGYVDQLARLGMLAPWLANAAAEAPLISAGIPMVGLEPSCVAVFRDELKNLFPDRDDAKRLASQTFMLSEFLEKHAHHYQPPKLHRKAIVHGHCHHKAIMKFDTEKKLLEKMELDFELLDSGCCGMAGSFGFEKNHYDISMAVGELVVLPAARKAAPGTLIITDGFSCREQIEQATGRHALHIAEVLQMALHESIVAPENIRAA